MKIDKIIFLLSSTFLFIACASPVKKNQPPAMPKSSQAPQIEKKIFQPNDIDVSSVQRLLGLDKSIHSLGYAEKIFNTCKVGYGFDTNQNCQQKYFVVIHFKISCRASEGTVSTILTEDDLAVVANQKLQWFLKNANGQIETDLNGFAEIKMISDISQKTERLRLSNANDFVLMRAGEIKSLIVPINWCN